MKSFTVASSVAALAAATLVQGQAVVNTPTSLVQCQPSILQWSGGVGPYYLSVLPGGMPSASPLETIGTFPASTLSYTWLVDIASGTSITITIKDSTGSINYAQAVTVQAGTSSACLGANTPFGGGAAVASTAANGAAVVVATATAPAPAGTTAAAVKTAAPASTAAAASAAAASTKPSSSLSSYSVSAGLVSLVAGLVALAL